MRDGRRTKIYKLTQEINSHTCQMWTASNSYLNNPNSRTYEHIGTHNKFKSEAIQKTKELLKLLEEDLVNK